MMVGMNDLNALDGLGLVVTSYRSERRERDSIEK
jgi:hypothetical protein